MSQDIVTKIEKTEKNTAGIDRRSYLKMVGAGAGLSTGSAGLTSLGVQSARANQESPCNTVDDFEDGNLSEYEFDRGSSGASVVSSPTYSGSYALEISQTNTEMISMDGLEQYPAAGDVFSVWVRGTNNADRVNITYGVQNHLNRYFARVNPEQGHVALYRYEDGSSTLLADKGVGLAQDTWYEVEIEWQTDGTHVFTLFNESGNQVSQISATDSTWDAGGIGYDAYLGDGGSAYFDHMQITSGREVVSANEVIDSFEDNDLTEYMFDRGSTGASVVSSPTYGGSSVLQISDSNTEMISTSGLDHYPVAGDVFSYWVQATDGASSTGVANVTYGVQDHDNRYYVQLDFEDNRLGLVKYENGSGTFLEGTGSVEYSDDMWYNVEIDWRKTGTHIVTVYDCDGKQVAQITGTDSTWTSGGIGYDAYLGNGETVYFDYVAIHSTVLDDFEDGDLSEYSGDTGSFTIQGSTVLERNRTLKGTSAPSAIAHTGVETPRGYAYETSVMAGSGSGAKPALMTCIQDSSSPLANCYYLIADPVNNTLSLIRQDNGSSVTLDEEGATINDGEEYKLKIELRDELVLGSIRDSSGNELAGVAEVDKTYSDGQIGLYLNGGSPAYFDHLTKENHHINILDNFEDGDISEYSGQTSYYQAQSSTVLEGGYSLKCTNNYTAIAHNTSQTNRGKTYLCHALAGSGSGSRPGLLACVQDANNPMENCYWAKMDPANDLFILYRRESGKSNTLDKLSVALSEGEKYRIAIALQKDKIKGILMTENGRHLAETDLIKDTTFKSGTFGFYTGGTDAPAYYDYVGEQPSKETDLVEVSTSKAIGDSAVNSTVAQEILSELNNPSVDTSNATRGNHYPSKQLGDGHVIIVPMEYGKLVVEYHDGSATSATAQLDRSTMSSSLIDNLSDGFGWPSGEKGILAYSEDHSEPKFRRSVTDTEKSDITSLVNDYDKRNDEPHGIEVKNNNGGNYRVMYYNKHYEVNEARDTVTAESKLYGSPDCENLKKKCEAQEGWDLASKTYSLAICIGAVIEPTPVMELFCLHQGFAEGASTIFTEAGGACKRYEEKCT